jgi:ribosomal protein S3AE
MTQANLTIVDTGPKRSQAQVRLLARLVYNVGDPVTAAAHFGITTDYARQLIRRERKRRESLKPHNPASE